MDIIIFGVLAGLYAGWCYHKGFNDGKKAMFLTSLGKEAD